MPARGIKYLVKQDRATGRWNVLREDQPTGAFARDQDTAIGSATRDASLEARGNDLKVSVWVQEGTKARKVWPA